MCTDECCYEITKSFWRSSTRCAQITSRVNLVDLLTSDPVLVEEEAAQSEQAVTAWQKQHDIECFSGYYDNISGADNWLRVRNTSNGNSSSIPSNEPLPMMKFEHGRFLEVVMKAIHCEGFESPTPIQSATWPMVLSGKNVISVARTGSGKTLTFLLPAMSVRRRPRRGDHCSDARAGVPDRGRGGQVRLEHESLLRVRRRQKWDQKRKLRCGVDIIIADFFESGLGGAGGQWQGAYDCMCADCVLVVSIYMDASPVFYKSIWLVAYSARFQSIHIGCLSPLVLRAYQPLSARIAVSYVSWPHALFCRKLGSVAWWSK